jgi:O-acetylhomoserine (thiol)-lyase
MKPETIALHAGYDGDPATNAATTPIYQTTSYTFNDTQHGADLFNLAVPGNIYSRIMNPTNAVLEARMAALEGGVGALTVGSGMAAIRYAIEAIAEAGCNIVSTSQLYGGTYNLFAHTFPRQGIKVRFADADDFDALPGLIDGNTRALFCESIGNPAGNIVNIQRWADIAHEAGVPLIVDNTVATPILCRVFDYGADIAVHSLTKYVCGHGTTIGGAIVDSGKFDWAAHPDRFSIMTTPDPSYHGVVYTEAMGEAAYIGRCRVVPLRNTGAALSPNSAFQIMQGLETLSLRMERHCENALRVANHLQNHPQIKWVNYAGLENSPHRENCLKFCDGKAAGILSFGIEGGIEAGTKFIDALQLILRLVNIGDAKSLACHPASTTHRQLNEEELASAGVSEEMVRLSIGIEHIDDILADIDQALEAAR